MNFLTDALAPAKSRDNPGAEIMLSTEEGDLLTRVGPGSRMGNMLR
jgi:hypothetical protein